MFNFSAMPYTMPYHTIPCYALPSGTETSEALTFMGRVASALLSLTDSAVTVYAPESAAWFATTAADQKQAAPIETCGIRTFALIERSLGAIGLRGLDRLMAFRTVYEFNTFLKFYAQQVSPFRALLEQFRDGLFPEYKITANTQKLYAQAVKKVEKLMLPMLLCIRRIGQSQLLRRQIANLLRFGCQLDAHLYYLALDTFNRGVVKEVRRHYREPEKHPYPNSDTNPIMGDTAGLLAACGMDDPLLKIYITTAPLEGLPQILFLFLLAYLPKVGYSLPLSCLYQ
jgi:WASH complex subunit strumpellin